MEEAVEVGVVAIQEEGAMADGFLGRWSRRKQEVREGKPVQEPPPPAPSLPPPVASSAPAPMPALAAGAPRTVAEGAAPTEAPPKPTLADAQALTPASDFGPFVDRAVAPEVRNLAMKKLFADPHFNVMDGLDIYVGDYTQPDPLPDGMLRKMVGAHALGFFDHEKPAEGAPLDTGAIPPAGTQPRDGAETAGSEDVAQSGVCNAIPSDPTSELEMAARSSEDAEAMPASHTKNDHDAHLRLQPDDAPQRQGVGRGTA